MAEVMENEATTTTNNGSFASKAMGNAGLTLGIIGTALGGLLALGNGASVLGIGGNSSQNASSGSTNAGLTNQDVYIERQQAQKYLDITKQYYEGQASQTRQLTDAFFDAYKRDVDNSFDLYKLSRDNKDELNSKIEAVDKKVDIMAAIRPYQDALIDAKINYNGLQGDYNLFKRTCKMMNGQLVLPSSPVVSGYSSYYPTVYYSSETE